jgi:hypothetical protein
VVNLPEDKKGGGAPDMGSDMGGMDFWAPPATLTMARAGREVPP